MIEIFLRSSRTSGALRGGKRRLGVLSVAAIAAVLALAPAAVTQADPEIARGEVLFAAGGCANCHTDAKAKGPLLGGGGGIKTPFGTFFAPNISPHPDAGIGKWTEAQFIRAMRDGTAPDGSRYYPAFPYTSFTNLSDADLKAMFAYMKTVPAVANRSRPHELSFPFNLRFGVMFWQWLHLKKGPPQDDPGQSAEWNRGRYLAEGLVHCAECHTPRNMLGGLDRARWMTGAAKGEGPEGEAVPDITSGDGSGIGKWSVDDLARSLRDGMMPDGDFYGSLMADVVKNGTGRLSDADRRAIAVYVKSLKAKARAP